MDESGILTTVLTAGSTHLPGLIALSENVGIKCSWVISTESPSKFLVRTLM